MFNFVSLHKGGFLHLVAKEGNVDLVGYLVDKGAPMNFTDDDEVIVREGRGEEEGYGSKINSMLELYSF